MLAAFPSASETEQVLRIERAYLFHWSILSYFQSHCRNPAPVEPERGCDGLSLNENVFHGAEGNFGSGQADLGKDFIGERFGAVGKRVCQFDITRIVRGFGCVENFGEVFGGVFHFDFYSEGLAFTAATPRRANRNGVATVS